MSEPVNLNVIRFNKATNVSECSPRSALEAALVDLDTPDRAQPDHIIIVLGRNADDSTSGAKFFQAGTYSYHAMIGLLDECKLMIRESCE